MSKTKKSEPRYFELFKTQHEFFSAELDEDFFITNHHKYSNVWKATRSSCLRLLLSHHDCPPSIRILYTTNPRVEVRALAFFGFRYNTKDGAKINFILENEQQILQDRAKSIRAIYLHNFCWIKLMQLAHSSKSTTPDYILSSYPEVMDNFGFQNVELFLHTIKEHIEAIDNNKNKLLDYLRFLLKHSVLFSSKAVLTLQELSYFLQDPALGLISSAPSVRDIAINYLRLKKA